MTETTSSPRSTKKKQVRKKTSPQREVFIVDGSRTPFLKAKGKPGPFTAADLALGCARPLMARQPFELELLDEVVMGCVMPGPDEANIARVIALRLGCDQHIPAWTVQRNCASGLQAIDSAAKDIMLGRANLVLAGGVESMSHAPVLLNDHMVTWLATWMGAKNFTQRLSALGMLRPKFFKPIIGLLRGLSDPVVGLSMGQTAENLAYQFNISRTQMDEFSVRSHQRLSQAQAEKALSEIEVIFDSQGQYYEQDDGVRADSSVEKLAKLKPVFDRPFGLVTAGNSAQITDGAAMLILASSEAVKQHKLSVLGKISDAHWAGLAPEQMGLGPVHAITPILTRNKLKLDDVDYWEINEAFAAQVLGCLAAWQDKDFCKTELGLKTVLGSIDPDRLNIHGGGISIGHPVGASGARIVLQLLHTLKQNNKQKGIASLCIGGGQGGAMLLECA